MKMVIFQKCSSIFYIQSFSYATGKNLKNMNCNISAEIIDMNIWSTMSESFPVNFSFSGPVVCERKTYKWPHPIFRFLYLSFEDDLTLYLNKLEFPLPQE
jgi:hypothetical protein